MAELFEAVDFACFAYRKKRELPTVASPFIGVQCTRDKRRIMFGARVRSSVGVGSCLRLAGETPVSTWLPLLKRADCVLGLAKCLGLYELNLIMPLSTAMRKNASE